MYSEAVRLLPVAPYQQPNRLLYILACCLSRTINNLTATAVHRAHFHHFRASREPSERLLRKQKAVGRRQAGRLLPTALFSLFLSRRTSRLKDPSEDVQRPVRLLPVAPYQQPNRLLYILACCLSRTINNLTATAVHRAHFHHFRASHEPSERLLRALVEVKTSVCFSAVPTGL